MESSSPGDLAVRLLAAIENRERLLRQVIEANTTGKIFLTGPDEPPSPDDFKIVVGEETAWSARGELGRCAADRRILERHREGFTTSTWDGTVIGRFCRCREAMPCPDLRDLADGYSLEVETG